MADAHSKLKSTPDKALALQPTERFYTDVPQGTKPRPN